MSLFSPFRALGYITDDVPFSVQRRGKETYVTVSVGKSWQTYSTAKLTLVLVGPQVRGAAGGGRGAMPQGATFGAGSGASACPQPQQPPAALLPLI